MNKKKTSSLKLLALTSTVIVGILIYANWDETKDAFMEGWNSVPEYESLHASDVSKAKQSKN